MKACIIILLSDAHLAKSSMEIVPIIGASRCVWGSMPPGMTYLPSASITRVPASPWKQTIRLGIAAAELGALLARAGLRSHLQRRADRFNQAISYEHISSLGHLSIYYCPSLQSWRASMSSLYLNMHRFLRLACNAHLEGWDWTA